MLQLLQRREKYLALGAIRFVRTCLGLKDDFYHRCAQSLLSTVLLVVETWMHILNETPAGHHYMWRSDKH